MSTSKPQTALEDSLPLEPECSRQSSRKEIRLDAQVFVVGEQPISCVLTNMGLYGFHAEMESQIPLPKCVMLAVPGLCLEAPVDVVWQQRNSVGLRMKYALWELG